MTRTLSIRLRLLASFALLFAICACGPGQSDTPPPPPPTGASSGVAPAQGGSPVVPPSAPANGTLTMPDAVMGLTEGGEVEPRHDGVNTVYARFADGDFEAIHRRITQWMPAHGWTLVDGSEVNSDMTARTLESLGLREAAELARNVPSYGASFQQGSTTCAVSIDSLQGTLTMSINWF